MPAQLARINALVSQVKTKTYLCCMKKKVLLVENDSSIREIITLVLSAEGYEVSSLCSGAGLFEHIIQFVPDVILLDIIRPTVEGTELCRAIKAAEGTAHIPVIVLSTHPKAEVTKEICADDVVPKPFDLINLVAAVDKQLQMI